MDAFHFSNVKEEKDGAMPRYNLFTGIAKTLHILELCLALLLLFWILTRLPFALRVSADSLQKLSAFLRSPLFVFAISNAIIVALVAQSGGLTAGDDSSADRVPGKPPSEADSAASALLSRVAVAEECQDKHIVDRAEMDTCTEKDWGAVTDSEVRKVYRRSESEKLQGGEEAGNKAVRRKLRRSETEKEKRGELLYPQDKLSNEEFQRTIEAFIAKQMRSLREEESLAIFVQTSESANNNNSQSA